MGRPDRPLVTRAGLAVAASNLALAAMYALFAFIHVRSFMAHARASVVLVVALELVFMVLCLVRAPAERAWNTPWTWLTTFGGTFAPLFLRPTSAASDVLWGQPLQIAGTTATILGAIALNRSFGIVPALRDGIKSAGPYRVVRHPLYASYTVANVGYLISNGSGWNLAVVVVAFAFQIARIHNEERVLSEDEAYVRYKQQTRWRLVPFVY